MKKQINKEERGTGFSLFSLNKIYFWLIFIVFIAPSVIGVDFSETFTVTGHGTDVKYRYSRTNSCWERNGDCPGGSPDWTGWDCVSINNANKCSGSSSSYTSYHNTIANNLKNKDEESGMTYLGASYSTC